MAARNIAPVVELSADQRSELESFARSRSVPHGLVTRARIVLLAADGHQNIHIAERLGTTRETVGKWRQRFLERGIQGLYDQLRPGRPRTHSDERVAELLTKTLQTKPEGATHWSTRTMAEATGLSSAYVHRVWRAFGVQPHRQKHFKLSNDPFFVEKVRDIVGLYLDPPENAMVLCVDEKTQAQALEGSQQMLPMGLGYVEGVTHDYVRHGTIDLFAALDVANGHVITRTQSRHRHQEFLRFLKEIDASVPEGMEAHLVLDNLSTHKHPTVKDWIERHPRFQLHFTPTYSSWLNQIERWFAIITERAIRRGSFTSVKDLTRKIDEFVDHYNATASPFSWHATADSILQKIGRLCDQISETGH